MFSGVTKESGASIKTEEIANFAKNVINANQSNNFDDFKCSHEFRVLDTLRRNFLRNLERKLIPSLKMRK